MDKIIRFQGNEYLLIGGDLERGGAIATQQAFRNFEPSYAHLKRDGTIWRYGDTIGHRDEIEVIGETKAEEADIFTALDVMTSPNMGGWKR